MDLKQEFLEAVNDNHPQRLAILLKTDFDPAFDRNHLLCFALQKGYSELIQLLLADARVNPLYPMDGGPVYFAKKLIKNNYEKREIIPFFLDNAYDRKNPEYTDRFHFMSVEYKLLAWAISHDFLDIVKICLDRDLSRYVSRTLYLEYKTGRIMDSPYQEHMLQQGYYRAIQKQNLPLIQLFLDDKHVQPSIPIYRNSRKPSFALVIAVKTCNPLLIEFLMAEEKIDLAVCCHAAFIKACKLGYPERGHLAVFQALMHACRTLSKTASMHEKEEAALSMRQLSLFETTLLEGFQFAITRKYQQHHMVTAQLLLEEECFPFKEAMIWSVETNNLLVLTKLLPKIDPSFEHSLCLRKASETGLTHIVALLLKDNRSNPQDCDNEAIRLAAKNGHSAIIKQLLKDKRTNPAANNNEALRFAIKNNPDNFSQLLQDERIKAQKAALDSCIKDLLAENKDNFSLIKQLCASHPPSLTTFYSIFPPEKPARYLQKRMPSYLRQLPKYSEQRIALLVNRLGIFKSKEANLLPEIKQYIVNLCMEKIEVTQERIPAKT